MKKVIKPEISNILTIYSAAYPQNTWEEFRNSGWEEKNLPSITYIFQKGANGLSPYKDIQEQLFQIQGEICAYCEQDFSSSHGDRDYIKKMIEHFHPKRDSSKNWGIDWNNLLGCCNGGACSNKNEYPTPLNLSCDQHKEIALSKINDIEGSLINPIDMPAFPCLFEINKSTGEILSNKANCDTFQFKINNFHTTKELVDNTIKVLNLNCPRLVDKRKVHIKNYHELIKSARENQNPSIYKMLCERFLAKKDNKYHSFFTTYRILLSSHAENYLRANNFSG